jgi:NADH-quinone oxidoreductase subunit J
MQLTGWAAIFFYLLATMTLLMGLLTITARNAVRSVLFLMSTLLSVAGLFLLLQAEFIAGVQILVYVGGVVVLFLFVVMLIDIPVEERQIYNQQFTQAILIIFLLATAFIVVLRQAQITKLLAVLPPDKPIATATVLESRDSQKIGRQLYTQAALPFEIASLLLLVAIIGAIRLAAAPIAAAPTGTKDASSNLTEAANHKVATNPVVEQLEQ